MIVGVYKIKNNINGKVIIGSVYNQCFKKRWQNGYCLNLNKSEYRSNTHLQRSWTKYKDKKFKTWKGEKPVFEFFSLEEFERDKVTEEFVLEREDFWMDHYQSRNPKFGYNKQAASHPIQISSEVKKRMSDAKKGMFRGEKSYASKLTEEEVAEIRKLYATLTYSYKELAEKFKVSRANIKRIVQGKTWNNSSYSPPEKNQEYQESIKRKNVNANSKLSVEEVKEIRIAYLSGGRQSDLAKKYEVTRGCIQGIIQMTTHQDPFYAVFSHRVLKANSELAKEALVKLCGFYEGEKICLKKKVNIDVVSEAGKKIREKLQGEKSYLSSVSNKQANEIRTLYTTGKYTQQEIADKFGVSRKCVGNITLGNTYRFST